MKSHELHLTFDANEDYYYVDTIRGKISQKESPTLINLCLYQKDHRFLDEQGIWIYDDERNAYYLIYKKIQWLYHCHTWVILHLDDQIIYTNRHALKQIRDHVPLVRVDKNCFICLRAMTSFASHTVTIGATALKVSPYYYHEFIKAYINYKY